MKKLLICLTLAAVATVTSLQAGEPCAKEKASASCSTETKGCCSSSQTASASKCSTQKAKVAKVKTDTVKGATLLVQR